MKKLIPLILVSVICLWTSAEAGQIYQWIDKNGVRHFTNEPPPPGAKIINEQKAIPYDKAADQKRTEEDQAVLNQDLNQQESQNQQHQQESQQENPATESDYSDSADDSEGVIVDPYVRERDRVRHYERRNQEREEIVTPLPRRNRMDRRIR